MILPSPIGAAGIAQRSLVPPLQGWEIILWTSLAINMSPLQGLGFPDACAAAQPWIMRINKAPFDPCKSVVKVLSLLRSRLAIQFRLQDAHERQVAVALGKIEAIAGDKKIGNGKSHIIGIHLHLPSCGLVEQHADFQTARIHLE